MAIVDEIEHPWVRSWVAHGEARGEAKAVLILLDNRGIPVSREAEERILTCTDQELLASWIVKAAAAESVEELFG
ncbi:hypothetical protein GCM10022419_001920 [Nonomuraea rosea]|uniref:Uncharacterized protein n=1 Tax=Nonomuraea rosea TaxID=638574 RepID=A0ABP6V134_9ACTN